MGRTGDSIAVRGDSKDHVGVGNERGIGSDELPVYTFQGLIAHLKLGIVYNGGAEAIDIGPGIRRRIHEIGAALETGHNILGIPVAQADLDGNGLEKIAHLEGAELKGQATAPGRRALVDELL